ncbi:hypothetical protein PLEOSDRAFT_1084896 [Pleurotus ostreatus PC15]|uniref:Uncharacterized protein n=1 Tax=Pleurotus ostreatus (strain PC15) TaxID=1137138 RepID=A0A067NMG0_PLEO1|nr:hypothetical protein PLEOSDRAFT_1084896 [Pleurotus ostreatus PC15]
MMQLSYLNDVLMAVLKCRNKLPLHTIECPATVRQFKDQITKALGDQGVNASEVTDIVGTVIDVYKEVIKQVHEAYQDRLEGFVRERNNAIQNLENICVISNQIAAELSLVVTSVQENLDVHHRID